MDEQSEKRRFKIPSAVIWGIVLLIVCGIALYIRVHFCHDRIFPGDMVWFQGADPWYHMRLVENLIQHFPHRIYFDPYTYFPHGCLIPWPPFYQWLIAAGALIVGHGNPSPNTVETVGAYTPAIMGALTIIPVYFIGKELFSRLAGMFAAVLVAILPGEFMNRSMLGFADHHVAEVLFSTTAILFVIMAVKRAQEREMSFSHLINRDWAVIKKPLIYALLAGIFLGLYLLVWVGGLLLMFILFVYLVIQFIVDHLRGKSTDYLCIIAVLTFAVAAIMTVPFLPKTAIGSVYPPSLAIAILAPLGLCGISRFMTGKNWKPAYYPALLLGIAGIGFLILLAINPSLVHSMLGKFSIFDPGRPTALTIAEAIPSDMPLLWTNFNTAFFISFISLGWLIYRAIKEKSADKTLFLVWCVVMLVALFGQRRFCYYFVVNVALLTGYFSWRVLDVAGLKDLLLRSRPVEVVKAYTTRKKKKKAKARAEVSERRWLQPRATWVRVIVVGIVIFFLVFFPSVDPNDVATRFLAPSYYVKNLPDLGRMQVCATGGQGRVGADWLGALMWLKNNTPEPFDDPDYYYQLYDLPPGEDNIFEDYDYPDTAYGVMSWWDYGHVITRIARRIPIANPFQQAASVAGKYLTSQNETEANRMMDELNAKYVVIDNLMAVSFVAPPMATWAGKNPGDFNGAVYEDMGDGNVRRVMLYYPPYYNSTVVRLYNFNGQAVVPSGNTTVICYQEVVRKETFPSYEEARDFIAEYPSRNCRIVGMDPFKSPVPLEKLEHYELVYTAPGKSVKIFEYTK